jgi:hypothetical protein
MKAWFLPNVDLPDTKILLWNTALCIIQGLKISSKDETQKKADI